MRTKHTHLLDWLKKALDEQIERIGATRGHLKQIAYGNRQATAEIASAVERETEGAVTRKDLRPNDWPLIWPELAAA